MKLKLSLLVFAVSTSLSFLAQNNSVYPTPSNPIRGCGTPVPPPEWDQWFNQKVKEFEDQKATGKIQVAPIVIPVIVHIIHGGQAVGTFPNISQAQVASQITSLNNDFAGIGLNVGNLAGTAFSAVGAVDTDVSFCLAEKDPSGNSLAEPGIDRRNYVTEGWTNPASPTTNGAFFTLMDGTIKPNSIWNPAQYLNIWVSNINNSVGILGYAYFPGGSGLTGIPGGSIGNASTDGIWVWGRSFGSIGSVLAPYNKGRTLVHEAGHYFGLRHIWGDGTCATDYCNDTPTQQTANFGCTNYPHVTCSNGPNGDMFMNFMDYGDDNCIYMFTPNQNTRIQTALANSPLRNLLNASSATLCNVPAVAPVVAFTVQSNICNDSVLVPFNQTTGSPLPTYTWVASPSAGVTFSPNANAANPSIAFSIPGVYSLTLNSSNAAGSSSYFDFVIVDNCSGTVGFDSYINSLSHLQILPNPASTGISIKTNFNQIQSLKVEVCNLLGEIVSENRYEHVLQSELYFNLKELPDGLYLVKLDNGRDKVVKRLVVKN